MFDVILEEAASDERQPQKVYVIHTPSSVKQHYERAPNSMSAAAGALQRRSRVPLQGPHCCSLYAPAACSGSACNRIQLWCLHGRCIAPLRIS